MLHQLTPKFHKDYNKNFKIDPYIWFLMTHPSQHGFKNTAFFHTKFHPPLAPKLYIPFPNKGSVKISLYLGKIKKINGEKLQSSIKMTMNT